MPKRKEPCLAELAAQYQRAHNAGQRAYARADRLLQQIAECVSPASLGEEIDLGRGRKLILKDRFEDREGKGVIWQPCAARRWELKIIEA